MPDPQAVTLDMSKAQPLSSAAPTPASAPADTPVTLDMSKAQPISGGGTGASGSWQPSLTDKIEDAGKTAWSSVPVVGPLHDASSAVQNWADKKMSPENPHMLSPAGEFGTGVVKDVAGLVHGLTSPEGVATTAATVAAPEVMGPALTAHGIHSMISGWGDIRDPNVLQNELNAGAEVLGGASTTGEAIANHGGPITQAARKQAIDKAIAKAPDQQLADFKNAIPPSKTAPYEDTDVHAARPYLEAEHKLDAIDDPVALRNAADSAVGKIEGRIASEIKSRPTTTISTNPLYEAQQALRGSVRTDFFEAGMKELENYPLGWQRAGGVQDPPLTLQKADDIRWQLNQDNKAVLARNNYDLATARATDPGFAAREAVSESLRNGVYDKLGQMGFKEARQLRLDEGSLLKIRNASLKQEFNGEKAVRQTGTSSPARKATATVAKKAAVGAGAGIGAHLGGTPGAVVGAEAGSAVGDMAARAIAPGPMTRNALLDRSFRPTPTPINPAQITNKAAGAEATAEAGHEANDQPAEMVTFVSSDGATHSVPKDRLSEALAVDPNLKVVQ